MPAQPKHIAKMAVRRSRIAHQNPAFFLGRFIFLIFVAVVAVFAWRIFSAWQARRFNLGDRVTIVVATSDPQVYSYNSQNNLLTIIKIPKNTEIDAAGGYGRWLVGSLWKFGIQEKKEYLLAHSIQKSFGIPIDGFIDNEESVLAHTNLNFFDRLDFLFVIRRVTEVNRREIDLVKSGVLVKKTLSDGTDGFVVVPDKAATVFSSLYDDDVFQEGKTLRIVNTTSTDGLGKDTFRIASTLGLRTLAIDSSEEKYTGVCKVRVQKKHRNSESLRRLVAIFGCEVGNDDFDGPTNIEMVLGENFAKIY